MKRGLRVMAVIIVSTLLFIGPCCTSEAPITGTQYQNKQGSIVGSWVAGDSAITFNADGTYTQTVQGTTFDIGTYTTNSGQLTMASRRGNTSTGSYRISGNTLTGFTDAYGKPTTYSSTSGTTQVGPTPSVTGVGTTSGKSIYDGTYTGTFNYEYRDLSSEPNQVGPWIPESFTLTLTFETQLKESRDLGSDDLVITNVICSDRTFGTGSNGVRPIGYFGGDARATLPVNPSKVSDSGYFGGSPRFELAINFPSGRANIRTLNYTHTLGYPDAPNSMKVSYDGKTLSSNPDFVSVPGRYSWEANTPEMLPAVNTLDLNDRWRIKREYRFGSWSLTKVFP